MSVDMEELVASPAAEVGAVLGRPGASEESNLPVAPGEAHLRSAEDVLAAIHAGSAQWLEEPLGWQEWLRWRVHAGRRDPITPAMSGLESQIWQGVMVELFGEDWRLRLHAFCPGAAVAEGLRAQLEEPLGGALEDGPLEGDIFDGASEAASGAFTEGSWGDRSDRELYQVLEGQLHPE